MIKLTDTQRVILSAAAQRTDRLALPLPKGLKGGAAQKVVNALVDKGLLKEVEANRKLNDPVWRETEDGPTVTLVITDAGLAAVLHMLAPDADSIRAAEDSIQDHLQGHALSRAEWPAFPVERDIFNCPMREARRLGLKKRNLLRQINRAANVPPPRRSVRKLENIAA